MGLDSFMRSSIDAFIQSTHNARNNDSIVDTGCEFLPCDQWPPKSVRFSFGQLRTGNPKNQNTTCCALEFSPGIPLRIVGLNSCLSKTWQLALQPIRGGDTFTYVILENGVSKRVCNYSYGKSCIIGPIPYVGDDSPGDSGDTFNLIINIGLSIQIKRNLDTGEITAKLELFFQYGIGHYFFGTPLTGGCGGTVDYKKELNPFDCDGPWTLDNDSVGLVSNAVTGFPATININPDYTDETLGGGGIDYGCCEGLYTIRCIPRTWNCLAPTICVQVEDGTGTYTKLVDCQSGCPASETYSCVNGVCADPGDGSGIYGTLNACKAKCITAPATFICFNNVNCIDPGNGTGNYADIATCQSNCTGIDTRTTCCPNGMPDILIGVVESDQCPCYNTMGPLAWIPGDNAYVLNYFGCNSTTRLRLVCTDGGWQVQLLCLETVVARGFSPIICENLNNPAISIIGVDPSVCCPFQGATVKITIYRAQGGV